MEESVGQLELSASEVHVWLAVPADICDSELLRRYAELLSPEERERHGRFYFARHQHDFLVSHALVRTVLSRYHQTQPAEWTFRKNEYGRPEIARSEPLGDIRFNLSHTDGLVAVAVVRACEVGIDVESTLRSGATVEIADRYFSPAE